MTKPPHANPSHATCLSHAIGIAEMWGGFRFSCTLAGALITATILNISAVAQTAAPEGPTGIDIIPTDLPAHASTVRSGNQPLSLLPGTIPAETRFEDEVEIPSLANQYQRTITGQPAIRPAQPVRQRKPISAAIPATASTSVASPVIKATQPTVALPRTNVSGLVETATPAPVASGDGFRIQLGAFHDRFTAETYWASFSIRYPELVRSYEKTILSADLGSQGIYHRLQLVGFQDSDSAQKQCRQLKADGTDCFATAR
jgi:cell division septation protein DedD